MKRTTTFTTMLYALFIAGIAAAATSPSSCPPGIHPALQLPSLWRIIPFALQASLVGFLLRRGRYVLSEGWCSQAIVWPLLLTGCAGAAMLVGCGYLEQTWPTLDPFASALHGGLWAVRTKFALLAGLLGILLFHVCARREPASTAP